MIKHVVMWKLKEYAEGNNKNQNAIIMKKNLESLKDNISEIINIEVGININNISSSFDIALIIDFNNEKELENYLNHPEHKKVGNFVSKIRDKRIVVDYKY